MSNVTINGSVYEVVPMRAKQYAQLANVLGKMSIDGRKITKGLGADTTAMDLVWAILASVTEDELIKLGAIALGTDEAFAKENFALDWITLALTYQIENANVSALIANFLRLSSLVA